MKTSREPRESHKAVRNSSNGHENVCNHRSHKPQALEHLWKNFQKRHHSSNSLQCLPLTINTVLLSQLWSYLTLRVLNDTSLWNFIHHGTWLLCSTSGLVELCNVYYKKGNKIHIVHRSMKNASSSELPLTSPIIMELECILGTKSHVVFLSRPWAAMQNKPTLNKEHFSAIIISLLKHRKFGIPTKSVHLYKLTDHHSYFKWSHAVNTTSKIKIQKHKDLHENIHNPEQCTTVPRLVNEYLEKFPTT